jgi:hypothetical protein
MFFQEYWSEEGERSFRKDHYYHQEGDFYQSRLNNPNILYIETVKQGCDI